MCQKLQDPAVRPISIGLLREVTGGAAIGRARLRVHPEVQKDTKNRHIAHLRGYVDGIHQLQANFSWWSIKEKRQRWVYRNHQNLKHPATMWKISSPWLSNVDFWLEDLQEKDMKEIEHTSSWSLSITALQPGCGIPSPVFRDSHDLAKRPSRIRIYSSVEEQPQWLFFNRAKK